MKSRVVSVAIDSYDLEKISASLNILMAPLGGFAKFIKPGMKVLINPNLLSARTPDRAVTTHPMLVAAVAAKCKELGAEPIIGDSPGGVEKGLKRVWDNTGMASTAESTGCQLVGFESGNIRQVSVDGRIYHLSRYAFDVDFIISLPKLKTHVLTLFTGAIKNCYGFIPGLKKSDYHKSNVKPKSFSNVLVDIFSQVKPGLFIMDGGLVMEGDGPASGQSRWMGYLFASTDGVAMDSSVASLLGKSKKIIWPTIIAAERKLGIADLNLIERTGPAFSNGVISDFKLPSNAYMSLIPESLSKSVGSLIWARPAINHDLCTLCQTCVDNCPQNVISESGGKLVFDYDNCIKCMCCHELCPEKAVYLEKSWLASRIGH